MISEWERKLSKFGSVHTVSIFDMRWVVKENEEGIKVEKIFFIINFAKSCREGRGCVNVG